MGFWSRVKSLLTNESSKVYKDVNESSSGLVAGVPSAWGHGQKAPFSFRLCFERYENVGLVTAAVDSTVEMIVGPGYHTVASSNEAKKVVDDFAEQVNLDGLLMDAVLDCAICGNAWIEKVYEDGRLVDLNYLDPLTMEQSIVLRKAPEGFNLYYPKIERYVQVVNSRIVASWPPGKIIHLTWNRPHNSLYGVGMVKPVERYLQTILEAEEDMGKIIKRYSAPKIAWMLENASKDTFLAVKNQLSTIQPDEDYVIATTGNTKISAEVIQIDPRSRFEYFFNHLMNGIMAGLECPITFLFRGDVRVSDASATAMLQAFDRKIRMKQRKFKRIIEAELFKPLVKQEGLDEVPRLIWGPLEVEKFEDKVRKWIGLLDSKILITNTTRRDIENELRRDMGLQPLPETPFKDEEGEKGR